MIAALILTVIWLLPCAAQAQRAVIIADTGTGSILEAKNADLRTYPASLTKMMTLYLLFEAIEQGQLRLDQPLAASRRAARRPPSRLGLRPGERITVEEAILALVVHSANDVATMVAEKLGKTEPAFARKMTGKARELGMTRTVFRNATGLHAEGHVSTARDLLTLARALITRFPGNFHYFSTPACTILGRTYESHNGFLLQYPGADGIKTGYTVPAGYNLAASARHGECRMVGVLLGGKSAMERNLEMERLLDAAFAKVKNCQNVLTQSLR